MGALADAVLVLGSNDAPLQRGLGASRKRVQTWGNLVAGDIDKAFKKGLSSLANLTGFAGVGLFAMQAREVLAFQDGLSKLGVSARLNQYQMAAMGDKIREAGVATGISSEEILGGIQAYVALTGDVKTASDSLEVFARAAQATGTPMADIAKTAAGLSMNLGITSKDMEAALSGIHSQGKKGAVEFNEMATIIGNLAPRFAQFGTVGVKGLGEMNGILQTMRVGFGTTGEAATSMEAIMGALTQGRTLKGLAAHGIQPFTVDSKGIHHMKDLRNIIAEIITKTHGDPIVLSQIFGRKEAISGIVKLAQAGTAEMDKMIAEAQTGGELAADFGKRLQSPAVQLAMAKERLNKVFSDALVRNLDTIVAAVSKLVDLIGWMVANKGAVIAMFAAIKGGGYLGSIGERLGKGGGGAMGMLGGGGGSAAAWGAYGGAQSAAARRSSVASAAFNLGGGLIQGAALGFGAHQLAGGMGMNKFEDAVFTVSAGLSALPGPLGMLGKTVAIGTGALTEFFGALNAGIDDLQKKIAEGKYGDHGVLRAREFAGNDNAADSFFGAMGANAPASVQAAMQEKKRRAANFLFRTAQETGALSNDEVDGKPHFTLDRTVLQKVLADEAISQAERDDIIAQTVAAVADANKGTGAVANEARGVAGVGQAPQLVSVEVGVKFVDGKPVAEVTKNDRRRRRVGK